MLNSIVIALALLPGSIPLSGAHKFAPGDDPAWASPEFDDSDWRTIAVPASWSSQGVGSDVMTGWYRFHIDVPSDFRDDDAAVALGVIISADEVFLNGERIGGLGVPGDGFVEAPWLDRLYRLPPRLLRAGRDNVLAVRVSRLYFDGGIQAGAPALGNFDRLSVVQSPRLVRTWVIDTALLTFFLLAFLFAAFFLINGAREPEYLAFGLTLALVGVCVVLESRLFFLTGLKTALVERIDLALNALTPAAALVFFVHACRRRWSIGVTALLAPYPVLALAFLTVPGLDLLGWVCVFWMPLTLGSLVLMLVWSALAVRRGLPESSALLMATAAPLVGVAVEFAQPTLGAEQIGVPVSTVALTGFLLCLLYALTARFQRLRDRLRALSVSLLGAHEEERRRLARDIHDGVGQSLSAIKLNLQMLQAGGILDRARIGELVSETSAAIDELRRVALDLRPDALERMDLAEALAWYAGKVQDRCGLPIHVRADAAIAAGARVKDHLYRICQEAIRNAVSHASPGRVDVALTSAGRLLVLEVRDDGKGFASTHGAGLGLTTIRERAELLGGRAAIISSPGKGTTVRVELPSRGAD